jgi:glycosyltransferase involved in cell wall biosynthesis
MKILMVTNTFAPHVGGVARSVEAFSDRYRELGHEVLVVCPSFEGTESSRNVLRVPTIEHFRHTSFSFPLPIPSGVHRTINQFAPDVVHSHHPFLLGDTALRVGAELAIPVVFTHHTQYDKYAHYLGEAESTAAKQFINDLDVGYCNLCDAVVAPSQTVADELRAKNVTAHMEVIPTGVEIDWWAGSASWGTREQYGIPKDAFVVGHVGRLAKEKNIAFLADAVATFLAQRPDAWFVVAGVGPCEADLLLACEKHCVIDRLLTFGVLSPVELRNIYHTFDVFAFASQSETQGIVLAEAMAAGIPVVAIDAPGVREIVSDRVNGRLLEVENATAFAQAIAWIANLNQANQAVMKRELTETAASYSIERSAQSMLELYDWAIKLKRVSDPGELQGWRANVSRIEREWSIWGNFAHAIGDAVVSTVRGKIVG